MTRMVSINTKIQQIAPLAGTQDVNERTDEFITKVVSLTDNGKVVSALSEKQIAWIEDIWQRHFS